MDDSVLATVEMKNLLLVNQCAAKTLPGTVRYGAVRYGTVRYDNMALYVVCTVWYSSVWYHAVWSTVCTV